MRYRIGYIIPVFITGLVLAFCLAGCGRMPETQSRSSQPKTEEDYYVYYTNLDGTALVRHEFKPKSEDFEGIRSELLDAFQKPDTADVKSALPEQVVINQAVTGINEIDVDFNAEYLSLDTVSELLLRAALVQTLLRLPGVNSIRFTVESQSLVIGDGEVGPMTEETFVVPAGNGINSYRNAQMTLYFPTGDGNIVAGESRSGYYSTNLNAERLVIEEMLNGPRTDGLYSVAVSGTLVQDVVVSNGFCIVDFSEDINNAPPGEVVANPETVLYAFANAIIDSCKEDRISGVRFRIGGSSDVRFRDQVNLDQIFSRNADIITSEPVGYEEKTEDV